MTEGRSRSNRGARCSSTNAERGQRFGKTLRIRRRRDFLAIQRHGKARHAPHFVTLCADRDDGSPPRLGVTVSRKVGNAVARNRVKRRVREFFRRHRYELPPARDFVFIAKSGADKLSYAEVVDELRAAVGVWRGDR